MVLYVVLIRKSVMKLINCLLKKLYRVYYYSENPNDLSLSSGGSIHNEIGRRKWYTGQEWLGTNGLEEDTHRGDHSVYRNLLIQEGRLMMMLVI